MKKNTILHKIGQLIVPLKRTVSPLEADSHSAPGGLENSLKKVSLLHRPTKLTSPTYEVNFPGTCTYLSRITLLLLLLLTLGINVSWGQDTDYSGTYYIGSEAAKQNNTANSYNYNSEELANNYYLCPTEGWYFYDGDNNTNNGWTETDNEKPFLTTYKCLEDGEYDVSKAVWVIEKKTNTDFYYIKQKKITANEKYRYLVSNRQITGTSSARRMRVHLEEVADETALENLGDLALFEIATVPDNLASNCLYIMPHSPNGRVNNEPYLVVNDGNYNNLKAGDTKGDGPNGTYGKNTQGTIGVYSTEPNGYWTLEVPRPVISFNASNQVEITDPTGFASAIYYTTNGDDPIVDPSNLYSAAFDPDDDVTTIKAIAIVDGKKSGVATFTPPFFLGSTHNYIIQSKNCKFYNMIPNVSLDDNTKYVSTLNVPCTTMAWHFEYAEEGYYYIVDANGWYMYCTTTDNTNKYIYLKSNKEESDGYKFQIASHANGGYNIIPKGQTKAIYKNNYGNNDAGLTPVKFDGTITNDVARWDLIPYSTTNLPMWEDAPFTVSTDEETYYYNIVSVSQPTKPLILNNSGLIKSEIVPTSDYDERKAMWVIKKVGVADDDNELLDFYTFQNAHTGQKLYYNGNGRNYANNVLQLGLPSATGASEQWSHFVIVQTEIGYNIIPRPIVDNTKAINRTSNNEGLNCINRRGGGDVLGTFYDDGAGSRWTFSQVDFCMPPVFEESEGNIIITCPTKGVEIHYLTDGNDPTASSTLYNNDSWSSSTRQRIKAIAVVKSGETVTASSDVVTLLNKPDVTLEAGPYTYKDAAWEPAVTKVSIGESGSETEAGIDPTTYIVSYSSERTNVGTVTVTLENKVEGNMYVWNASTTFDITQKAVTVTADSDEKVYDGTALTKNTFTNTALVEGHTVTSVTVTGTQTVVGESNNVPSAAVIKKDEIDVTANYNITYENGKLTVTKRSLEITADSETKEYDGTALTKNSYTLTNNTALATGDAISSIIVTGSQTIVGESNNVPSAAVIKNGNGEGEDVTTCYNISYKNGTLKVTKKTLTITADSGEKVYDGTPLTKNSYTNTDLLSGDVLESVTVTGTQTDAGESDNVPSAAVIKNANSEVITESYNVVYKNGKLKVTAKPVTITADSGEKEYDGTALTKNTYTHTALVEGHTITSVTITGTQTNVGTSNNVPSAAVIKKGEDVVTANYNITYTNGTLEITPAAATVAADAKTKVYGDAEPTYTATVTGLKNNEAASVLTYTFSRATGENVGEYTITPAGEATQGNYTVTYATGKLTITKAAANVKADDKTKGYGDADPAFTATVTGLKNGDAASVLTYTFSRAEGENVNAGGYTITPAGNAEQGNYTVTYATGKLTITPKAINDGTNPAEGIDVDITYDGGTNYTVVVKQGEKTLVKDTDYELPEGSENQYDDADGNHVITIKGKDGSNYTGSFKATYIKLTFWDTTPDASSTSETWAAVYYNATQNLKVSNEFDAYYVTNLANNTLTLTKVDVSEVSYIPANQPVLLIGEATSKLQGFTVKTYSGSEVSIPASGEGSNLLKVVTDEGGLAVALTQVYIFSQGEFVLTKAGTMSKGKFYLENPNYSTPAPSRSIIRITTEGTTGINTAQYIDNDSQHSDTWYTIGGQKLHKKPTRKGIYLQNGKKVVIK